MSHTNLGLCDCIVSILIYMKLVLRDSCEVCGHRERVLTKYEFEAMTRKG